MNRNVLLIFIVVIAAFGFHAGDASAQINWRVSVKVILDAAGNRPNSGMSSDQEIQAQVDVANQILDAMGRGYRLQLTEIVLADNLSLWFDTPINPENRDLFEQFAKLFPDVYHWRSDAINGYVNNGDGSAICSFPPDHDIIMVGQNPRQTSLLHETGHFMDLCHTQGCPCGECRTDTTGVCHTVPGDDEIDDTVLDLACWDEDDLAMANFGVPFYYLLTPAQQERVDDVYYSVISYHSTRNRFTQDQLDRMTCSSNGVRTNVSDGETWIVGTKSGDEECLNSIFIRPTFQSALDAFAGNDIILMRGGNYPYTGFIDRYVFVRGSRGLALIGSSSAKLQPSDDEVEIPPARKLPDTYDGRTGP